jgi:hypothetical protein
MLPSSDTNLRRKAVLDEDQLPIGFEHPSYLGERYRRLWY